MSKLSIGIAALAIIALEATPSWAVSEARKVRQFSCTEDCTGRIDCNNLNKCKDPANKCLVAGGLLSKLKGRLEKVNAAIKEAEGRCKPMAQPAPEPRNPPQMNRMPQQKAQQQSQPQVQPQVQQSQSSAFERVPMQVTPAMIANLKQMHDNYEFGDELDALLERLYKRQSYLLNKLSNSTITDAEAKEVDMIGDALRKLK